MKTAVITGASGGLGRSLARVFEQNGYIVCGLSRTNSDSLENFFFCDVTSKESVDAAFEKVREKFGGIDVAIINSGVGIAGDTQAIPEERVRQAFDVNFMGALYSAQAAAKLLKKGGKLIGISSAAAFFALPYRSIYSASKSAMNHMLWGLSVENEDIQIASVCPGEIDTPFTKNRLWHVDEASPHAERLKRIADRFEKGQKKRMDAGYVAAKIFSICEKRKLSPLYIIGFKYKLFYFLQKIMPLKLLLRFAAKKYGAEK